MAHMIENDEMAYVGAKPWHGLGVAVAAGATGAEMLQAAKLDWKVELRDLAFMLPGPTGDLVDPLKIYRAVTRSDNDKVFQVATTYYHPVQNDQIVDFFQEFCAAGHATMETVGALRGGAVVWALANLGVDATIGGVDKLKGYLLLATSHDGSMVTIGRATQVRVVCHNTLSAALRGKGQDQVRISHSQKWTQQVSDNARAQMGMAVELIHKTNAIAETLAQITIDSDDWLKFMGRLMGEDALLDKKGQLNRVAQSIQNATVDSPGSDLATAKGTLWGAVNGVTYFSDHQRGKNQDSRMAASWFGEGERLKNGALQVAMQMAGVSA